MEASGGEESTQRGTPDLGASQPELAGSLAFPHL
jgi:hypothetical protein